MQDNPQSRHGVSGLWLGAGASLLIIALLFHGPIEADLSVQMQHVGDGHARWALVHWTAAAALVLFSGAGFMKLSDQDPAASSSILRSAWAVFALGALMTVSTAVAEASVVSVAANLGDETTFNTWWAYSSGMANGFFALAIASAVIALAEARSSASRMPAWASGAGAVFGLLSATGWSLGEQLGFSIGGPIWLVSTLLMCGWLAWFGFAARSTVRGTASPKTT